jgi:phosphate transport system permease protein
VSRRLRDRAFSTFVLFCAAATLSILAVVVGLVLSRGFGALSLGFFLEQIRSVGAEGGVFYHIVGTLILITTSALFAIPVAAGTAIFAMVYLPAGRRRRFLDGMIHALNGIPSIVFGLFGLAFFFELLGMKKSWLSGGLLLGIMIVPTIAAAFQEKLRAIPATTIEAAMGLGLSRAALVTTVLLPQALSGLVTGTLLGLARAAGETAPIMFTAVIFAGATVPHGIVDSPVLALPYHIFVLAQDSFDPRVGEKVWGTAIVLLMIVLSLSALALPLRLRIHEEARRA